MVETFLSEEGAAPEAAKVEPVAGAEPAAVSRETPVAEKAAETPVALTPEQIATADKDAATAAVTAAVAKMTPEEKAAYDALPADKKAEADAKVATDAKAAADKAAMHGAPEAYTDFTVPEGMTIDKTRLDAFVPVAKGLDLSQAGTQKLIDFYAGVVKEQEAAQMTRWADTNEEWRTATKADKEIGGANMPATKAAALSAIKQFGTPELATTAEAFGWANHPEFLRFAARVGKAAAEDKLHVGSPGGEGEKPLANRLFPNQA